MTDMFESPGGVTITHLFGGLTFTNLPSDLKLSFVRLPKGISGEFDEDRYNEIAGWCGGVVVTDDEQPCIEIWDYRDSNGDLLEEPGDYLIAIPGEYICMFERGGQDFIFVLNAHELKILTGF